MSKINYSALSTAADFKNAANGLYKRNMSTKKDMQSALICAMVHMEAHGDWTSSMQPLLDVGLSFGKNLNVALQEWVLKFTWLAYDEKAKAFHKDQSKVMDLAGAKDKEWWTMEKPAKAVPYDLQKAVDTLFKGIATERSKANTTLTTDTVFSAIETKMTELIPVEVQIETLFGRLRSDADRNEMLKALVNAMVPAVVIPAEVEVEAAAA